MKRITKLALALSLTASAFILASSESASADRPKCDRYGNCIYRHHKAAVYPRGPYPGDYRYSSLRYHQERTNLLHAGPYYHVWHGPILFGRPNRPAAIGIGGPMVVEDVKHKHSSR